MKTLINPSILSKKKTRSKNANLTSSDGSDPLGSLEFKPSLTLAKFNGLQGCSLHGSHDRPAHPSLFQEL